MQHRRVNTRNSRAAAGSGSSWQQSPWNMVTSLILAVVLVLLVAAAVTTVAFAGGGDNYLYHSDGEQTSPVMEHLLPKDRPKKSRDDDHAVSSDAAEEEDAKNPPPPEFLFPQGVARVVEFYAPWCGHCRHFKSHYVDLATKTSKMLSDAGLQRVEFHAVSCVAHKQLCKDHNVHAYPTVVACKMWSDCGASYDENGENGGKGSPVVLDKKLLTPQYIAEQLGIPLKGAGGGGSGGGGDTGAVTSAANDAAATDKQKVGRGGKLKKAPKNDTKNRIKKKALEVDRIFNDEHAQTQENLYSDAAKSFYFSLEQGVYSSNGPLPPVRRGAFVDWINLLSRTLPEAWTDVQSTLDDLRGHFVEGEESAIFENEDGLMDVVNPHRTNDRRHDGWSSNCSKKPGAGYTCGLWELFHIMSVGVAERNFSSSRGARDSRVSTLSAAEALRGFVANFFGCQECKTHFLDMYDSCKFDRCTRLNGDDASSESWREFALWLWEVHNDVNVRLRREEAERWGQQLTRRDEEEARWPSRTECGQCWHDDGSWNENTVYLYLKHVYWPGGAGHASFLAGSKPASAIGGRRRKRRSYVFEKSNGVATIILFFLALLLFVPILFHRKKVQWTGMHKKSDSTKMIV